jgi:hypothetical protein
VRETAEEIVHELCTAPSEDDVCGGESKGVPAYMRAVLGHEDCLAMGSGFVYSNAWSARKRTMVNPDHA